MHYVRKPAVIFVSRLINQFFLIIFYPELYPYYTTLRTLRKTKRCLNCNRTLDEIYNFCPHCGQENNDQNVSFGTFIQEFFTNYFAFDTKIGRSVVPFFFKPGYLANCFNQGKRASYIHPLRLYLVVSLFFFFIASLLVRKSMEDVSLNDIVNSEETTPSDTAVVNNFQQFLALMRNESLSDPQVIDSLARMDMITIDSSGVSERILHQSRRVLVRNDVFVAYILQNLPVMMFMLLPLFALLLKIFYFRRNFLYVQHLVHALHLHAFAFMLYGLLLAALVLFNLPDTVFMWLNTLAFFGLIIYIFISFWRVYRQGWLKTFVKLFLLASIYLITLLMFGLSEILVSFMIF